MATNQGFASLICRDGLDVEYLYYVLAGRTQELERLASGSTFIELAKSEVRKLRLLLPPVVEQGSIVGVLNALDTAIERTRAVIDQTSRLKNALLQDLLTHGLPGRHARFRKDRWFGQVPLDWQVGRLGAYVLFGPQNGLYRPEKDYGKGTRILRIDCFAGGEYLTDDLFQRVQISSKDTALYGLEVGDLVINRVNSMDYLGKAALVASLREPAVFESNMMRLRLRDHELRPKFLLRVLGSRGVRRQIVAVAKKAVAQCSINQDDVDGLAIPVPSVEEQDGIVSLLDGGLNRLRAEEVRLSQLERTKTALSQALLTGRVRLADRKGGNRS